MCLPLIFCKKSRCEHGTDAVVGLHDVVSGDWGNVVVLRYTSGTFVSSQPKRAIRKRTVRLLPTAKSTEIDKVKSTEIKIKTYRKQRENSFSITRVRLSRI